MKTGVDAIFFMPFCETDYHMLLDTIDSVEYHVKETHHIIAVDDCSPSRWNEQLKRDRPHITVLRNSRTHGGRSGLYVTQAIASKYALEHFDFTVFIKIDTDALMVGRSLVTMAIDKFQARPELGILGSYRFRADGHRRQWWRWKLAFFLESTRLRILIGRPPLWRAALKQARQSGYDVGENILGGCYILNVTCLQAMAQHGYLDYEYDNVIAHSRIGDEIIFSLFCKASGFDIGDFGRPDDPMVIALDVVPMPTELITAKGKSVIHSVKKGFRNETQHALREHFRALRT